MTSRSLAISDVVGDAASSDVLVCQEARRLLVASGYRALVRLECAVQSGVLELRGTVDSYFLKQLAQSIVRQLAPVAVKNSIEVAAPEARPPNHESGGMSYTF